MGSGADADGERRFVEPGGGGGVRRRVIQLNLPARPRPVWTWLSFTCRHKQIRPTRSSNGSPASVMWRAPIQSESGLPLAAVSFAVALRLAGQTDTLNDAFLEQRGPATRSQSHRFWFPISSRNANADRARARCRHRRLWP